MERTSGQRPGKAKPAPSAQRESRHLPSGSHPSPDRFHRRALPFHGTLHSLLVTLLRSKTTCIHAQRFETSLSPDPAYIFFTSEDSLTLTVRTGQRGYPQMSLLSSTLQRSWLTLMVTYCHYF